MAQDANEAAQTIALRAEISAVRDFLVQIVCPHLEIKQVEGQSPLLWIFKRQIDSIESQVAAIGEHCTSEACEKIIALLREEIAEIKKGIPKPSGK